MSFDVRSVDAESLLWSILEFNKVEEVSLDVTVDEFQCSGYGSALEANFSFVPWSKVPLLDEPIVNNRHWNGTLYYPGVDVRDLLLFIAKESIEKEHKLEPYCKYDCAEDLIVYFITKKRRIWVDMVDE